MDLQLYIHGNPHGFKYDGHENEKDSFNTRYYAGERKVEKELRIEAIGNKCYYTYFLSKNVLDTHGRKDSYFGITISIDAYYSKALNVYSLLDNICNKFVIGKVLEVINDGFKYKTDSFGAELRNKINVELATWFIDMYNNMPADFTNPVIAIHHGDSSLLNLRDSSPQKVENSLRSCGGVSISYEYPSLKEQQLNADLTTKENEWMNRYNELQAEYSSNVNQLETLKSNNERLEEQLTLREGELANEKKEKEALKNDYNRKMKEKDRKMQAMEHDFRVKEEDTVKLAKENRNLREKVDEFNLLKNEISQLKRQCESFVSQINHLEQRLEVLKIKVLKYIIHLK